MNKKLSYVDEPEEKEQFTEQFDRIYTSFAKIYDGAVKILPFWKRWLKATLPRNMQILGSQLFTREI